MKEISKLEAFGGGRYHVANGRNSDSEDYVGIEYDAETGILTATGGNSQYDEAEVSIDLIAEFFRLVDQKLIVARLAEI